MRVLTVLEILQAREQVTGAELAARLEVNLRTVQRYIARLQDLSIPVEASRGVGGSYRLKPGFRLPPLMLTDEEAFALMLGLRALRHLGLSAFAPATEGAAAKLGRVVPQTLRESVESVDDVITLEAGPWTVSTPGEWLMRVATAIRARRCVEFEYASHSGASTLRQIEPYGVLHVDGRWYLVGYCLLRQALRTFRLDRVSALQQMEQTFQRPAGFNVKAYLEEALPFVQSTYQVEVWLGTPASKARKYLCDWRVAISEEDGGTVLRCGRDHLRPFAAMLLSFGCEIIVRQPAELQDTFAELATAAAAAAQSAALSRCASG
ncbi:MAG TPA: YafY family protein [Bryobacteraceae bacterium]|nr:YafY family protein [Bryobacteraceae bacterium]